MPVLIRVTDDAELFSATPLGTGILIERDDDPRSADLRCVYRAVVSCSMRDETMARVWHAAVVAHRAQAVFSASADGLVMLDNDAGAHGEHWLEPLS